MSIVDSLTWSNSERFKLSDYGAEISRFRVGNDGRDPRQRSLGLEVAGLRCDRSPPVTEYCKIVKLV